MLVLIFGLPFLAALLCLGLNRTIPTRWLGVGAAAACLLAAGTLLLAQLPLGLPEHTWVLLDERAVRLALDLDAADRPFIVLALGGGGLALLALALALPASLRGFGGLFAALLISLLAMSAALADQEPLLLSFAWAVLALLHFITLRASGTTVGADGLPTTLLGGLLGALLLLAAALAARSAAPAALATPAILVCWTLVALLALGAPPFHAPFDEPAAAPAALAAALIPLGLPLLGGYALIRFATAQGASGLSPTWRLIWASLGLLALLLCAAGALNTTRMRQLIGWQFSAQIGLVFLALAQAAALAPALLANAALTTLACYLAAAVLERRAGTDDLAEIGAHGPLVLPGLAFLVAAGSAVGLPGTWGWWAQSELIGGLLREHPWAIGPLLAAAALRALAYIAPLAAFWRRASARPAAGAAPRRGWPTLAALLTPAAAALPLLIWGVAPQLAWNAWATAGGGAIAALPAPQPDARTQAALGLAGLALLALPILAQRGCSRCTATDQQIQNAAILTPQALGHSLHGLEWLGAPTDLFRGAWAGLLRLSRLVARGLALFEQRYYLAGLMIALIVVIMLLI
jgi:formate hydrogenlyase subunit 3/multisubunit Na+/H+ antiporter MnhD subunit